MSSTSRSPRGCRCGAIILLLMLVLAPVSGAAASPEGGCQSAMAEARVLLRDADADPGAAGRAAALLEQEAPASFRTADCPLLLAEAWYRSADSDGDIEQTYPVFEKVRAYAEQALAIEPGRTEAHYWLGLAKLRRAQKIGGIRAFFLVWSGIRELEQVRAKVPEYDHGGASRVLSLLYRLAPQWTPFGNIDKSVRYALDAVRISGDYPLNRLYLARSYLKDEKVAAAVEELRKVIARRANPFADEARQELARLGQPVSEPAAESALPENAPAMGPPKPANG